MMLYSGKQTVARKSILLTPRGVTWLGMLINLLLSAAKIAAGILFSSQTIMADGLHSSSDLVTDLAVLAGLRFADRPADRTHHYGHGRINTLAAMFVGAALLGAATWIAYEAIVTLSQPDTVPMSAVPFWIALASIPSKEGLYQITRIVGQRTSNVSLLANAWHHRSDAFTSVAAAAGLAGATFGGVKWAFLDHVTAMVLSAFLAVAALKILYSSASELIDRAPHRAVLKEIEAVLAQTPGVEGYHAFRAREIGGKIAMDVHILVDPQLTVIKGHDIATAVERRVMQADHKVLEVIVHIEPAEGSD